MQTLILWLHVIRGHDMSPRITAHEVEYFCACGRRFLRTR